MTGGAGFIGSHLVDALLAAGANVVVLDDFSTGSRNNLPESERLIVAEGDVRDIEELVSISEGAHCIFHYAALVSVQESFERPQFAHSVNVEGTLAVLEAARRNAVPKVVFASTSAVYGDVESLPVSESAPHAPISPYGAHKAESEVLLATYARMYGVQTIALRHFNVFGNRQSPDSPYAAVIPRFVAAMRSGEPATIFGDGSNTRDFIFVSDAAEAAVLAAASNAQGVFNIASGEETSLTSLVKHINEALGTDIAPTFAPPREGDIARSVADIASAKEALGFEPKTSLVEGLRALL